MTQDEYKEEIKKLHDECVAICEKKNQDYARSDDAFYNFREFGTQGILVRISDKWARIKTLIAKGKPEVNDESLDDTLKDLANYALILILFLKSEFRDRIDKVWNPDASQEKTEN